MEAAGIDVSDHALKYIQFRSRKGKREVSAFGEVPLAEGVIEGGEVVRPEELTEALRALKRKTGLSLVRSALPESRGYLFQSALKGVSPSEARSAIEFQLEEHVPIARQETVFDAEALQGESEERHFVVTAFPGRVVAPYVRAFRDAGLFLLSLELEAQAIARSVVKWNDPGTFMIADLGETHTGISVVSEGVVHYTSTIDISGRTLTAALAKSFSIPEAEAQKLKHEKGFSKREGGEQVFESLMTSVSALFDEINRRSLYWNEHFQEHSGKSKISRLYLCGGNANIFGLSDYLSSIMSIPVSAANSWGNAFSPDTYVPPLSETEARRFATAIGLALRQGS